MKKKIFSIILAICLIIPAMFLFTACGDEELTFSIIAPEGMTVSNYKQDNIEATNECNNFSYNGYDIIKDNRTVAIVAFHYTNTNIDNVQFGGNTGETRIMHFVIYTYLSTLVVKNNDVIVPATNTARVGVTNISEINFDIDNGSIIDGISQKEDETYDWGKNIGYLKSCFDGEWAYEFVIETTENIVISLEGLN